MLQDAYMFKDEINDYFNKQDYISYWSTIGKALPMLKEIKNTDERRFIDANAKSSIGEKIVMHYCVSSFFEKYYNCFKFDNAVLSNLNNYTKKLDDCRIDNYITFTLQNGEKSKNGLFSIPPFITEISKDLYHNSTLTFCMLTSHYNNYFSKVQLGLYLREAYTTGNGFTFIISTKNGLNKCKLESVVFIMVKEYNVKLDYKRYLNETSFF